MDEFDWKNKLEKMIQEQIIRRGIHNSQVVDALRQVPRHLFVEDSLRVDAYEDRPLPIGWDQTISQPYIVAYMTENLGLEGWEKVLEVGTGSGYQTAILARLGQSVYTVEMEPELALRAQSRLKSLGCSNVYFKTGDGLRGWEEEAPFGRILVTAALAQIPEELLNQLGPGGWLLAPVGGPKKQYLERVVREADGFHSERLIQVLFVPAHI
ncbi:MAG: protein-L-isoaspartate(D-aspartate) O-methyltransferase, partial [Elusimicrobia bacterium]|nr:protein-L-isoaspartate(D-aspartate) O-methyltransferase [Elusimicrobiota bacterium]